MWLAFKNRIINMDMVKEVRVDPTTKNQVMFQDRNFRAIETLCFENEEMAQVALNSIAETMSAVIVQERDLY